MIDVPLWLVPTVPLVLVLALCIPALRPYVRALVPLAPLPALLAALAGPGPMPMHLDWLLLGTDLAMTETAATFLMFTALLWGLAGWQLMRMLAGDPTQTRTTLCFLFAMSGNLGLLIAQDMAAFYTFFAMMSIASWGLVLHGGGAAQTFAGWVYIAFAVAGEVALFAGLAIGAFAAGDLQMSAMTGEAVPLVATVLVSVGFLVKLGAVPLHLWLPLAHAAAPAPASAVLSGAMLKAGLFGLITVLPLGQTALPEVAVAFAAMAVAGLILAPILGLVQGDPKAVLAYSSIGQMSLILLGLAAALAAPQTWPLIAPALVMLAVHHAFAKAALFLGVPAVWSVERGTKRIVVLAVLALPALALAGMPFTSGWLAKGVLKAALEVAPDGWKIWLGTALFIASLGTALLMLRALFLLERAKHKPEIARDVALPWLAMTALVVFGLTLANIAPDAAKAVSMADIWPLVTAGGLTALGWVVFHYAGLRMEPAAPGELLGMVRGNSRPQPEHKPMSPKRTNPLVIRRGAAAELKPEHGALAILSIAAGLALFMMLMPLVAQIVPSQPTLETVE
ncbi:MAG: formate hydrogenlyase subunit 3/multisubunit Na+/H+ antiporter MnhD subunit [Lentimonas sp.]|jgi:formate hydrogenlyase subunit 3/multisubunit Na+/H+ antiporter MnhD subunit